MDASSRQPASLPVNQSCLPAAWRGSGPAVWPRVIQEFVRGTRHFRLRGGGAREQGRANTSHPQSPRSRRLSTKSASGVPVILGFAGLCRAVPGFHKDGAQVEDTEPNGAEENMNKTREPRHISRSRLF